MKREMLFDYRYKKIISEDAKRYNTDYIKGEFEHREVKNGFQIIGKLEDGRRIKSFLSIEEYLQGKIFKDFIIDKEDSDQEYTDFRGYDIQRNLCKKQIIIKCMIEKIFYEFIECNANGKYDKRIELSLKLHKLINKFDRTILYKRIRIKDTGIREILEFGQDEYTLKYGSKNDLQIYFSTK